MFEKLKAFAQENWLQLAWSFEHWRYNDWMISITELLSIFVDPWFEYIKIHHADKLKAACERWTRIHENIEKWTDKKDPFYRRYREWKLINGVTILHKEKKYTRDNIRGTIDAVIESEEVVWPLDYKSSLRRNEKYCLQVAGYCWLTGYKQWWILYLSEDKYIYEVIDIEKYLPIFEELVEYSKTIIAINPHQDGNEERWNINDPVCSEISTSSDFWSNWKSKKL